MEGEIWIAIVAIIAILILFFANKEKIDRIEELKSDRENERKELYRQISKLKEAVAMGENMLSGKSEKYAKTIEELRETIAEKLSKSKKKYELLYNEYAKLMHSYMLARKKSEIDVVEEIEQSILQDYEELGSKGVPATTYIASAMADFYMLKIKAAEEQLRWTGQKVRSTRIADLRKDAKERIERAKKEKYAFEGVLGKIIESHPEIKEEYVENGYGVSLDSVGFMTKKDEEEQRNYINRIFELLAKCSELEEKLKECENFTDKRWPLLRDSVLDYQKQFASNLTAIPYMSRIVADIMTVDIDRLAWSLSWGNNQERKKKVISLNALKKQKAEEIERLKGAEYQLAYLLELYPVLQEVIDAEFRELELTYDEIIDYDPVKRYIDQKEWEKLSQSQRNQLALEKYIESRRKSKWQIGRDYELYCGYCYEKQGYKVDYFGSYKGLEDLGRDLIVKKNEDVRIVQCKYWSQSKQIHENHIMQLYGSVVEYNLENKKNAEGILITNTCLSNKAKEFAKVLGITYKEKVALGEFPRIKCNIGVGENGEKTKIYHLPFDQQYDATKVEGKEEFMAMTVMEAEQAGFRRAFKWHGSE